MKLLPPLLLLLLLCCSYEIHSFPLADAALVHTRSIISTQGSGRQTTIYPLFSAPDDVVVVSDASSEVNTLVEDLTNDDSQQTTPIITTSVTQSYAKQNANENNKNSSSPPPKRKGVWAPPSQNVQQQRRGKIFSIREPQDLLDFVIEDERLSVGMFILYNNISLSNTKTCSYIPYIYESVNHLVVTHLFCIQQSKYMHPGVRHVQCLTYGIVNWHRNLEISTIMMMLRQ